MRIGTQTNFWFFLVRGKKKSLFYNQMNSNLYSDYTQRLKQNFGDIDTIDANIFLYNRQVPHLSIHIEVSLFRLTINLHLNS